MLDAASATGSAARSSGTETPKCACGPGRRCPGPPPDDDGPAPSGVLADQPDDRSCRFPLPTVTTASLSEKFTKIYVLAGRADHQDDPRRQRRAEGGRGSSSPIVLPGGMPDHPGIAQH